MTIAGEPTPTVVLVGGHESSYGTALPTLTVAGARVVTIPAGGRLERLVSRLLDTTSEPVVVVPMTFGRDPRLVADSAKTLRWLASDDPPRLALAAPFGTVDHLTGWLRRAATQVRASTPDAAVLLTADTADPFDDAELYRIAHLVRTFGAGNEIEVGIVDSHGSTPSIDRLSRLGHRDIVLVPAGFRGHEGLQGSDATVRVRPYGPLLSDQTVAHIVRQRLDAALHHLDHGETGIAAGLGADHGRGYAHSHGTGEEGHEHGHGHHHEHHDQNTFIYAH